MLNWDIVGLCSTSLHSQHQGLWEPLFELGMGLEPAASNELEDAVQAPLQRVLAQAGEQQATGLEVRGFFKWSVSRSRTRWAPDRRVMHRGVATGFGV